MCKLLLGLIKNITATIQTSKHVEAATDSNSEFKSLDDLFQDLFEAFSSFKTVVNSSKIKILKLTKHVEMRRNINGHCVERSG